MTLDVLKTIADALFVYRYVLTIDQSWHASITIQVTEGSAPSTCSFTCHSLDSVVHHSIHAIANAVYNAKL